jgi:hypothetical protein
MDQDYSCASDGWTLGRLCLGLVLIFAAPSMAQAQGQSSPMSPSPQASAQARATARILAAGDTREAERPVQFLIGNHQHKYLMRRIKRTDSGQIRVDFE